MREEDKTKERLAEEVRALRDRCAGLEAAIEGVTDAVFVKDSVGRYLAVNAAAASLFGKPAGEVIGRGDAELLPPAAVRQNTETDRTVIAGGSNLTIESTATHPGAPRSFLTTIVPYRDALGAVIGVAGVSRDVTARMIAEDAPARDALLLANVRDSVIVTDPEGVVTYWNEGATRLFGWRADEMLGRPLVERMPEEGRGPMVAATRAILEGEDFAGEWESYRKDGSRVWVDARVTRITDATGRPVAVMGLAHDVTDRKRAEKALRDSEQQVRLLLDSTGEAIFGVDLDGLCTFSNASCLRLLGYADHRDLLGRNMHNLIHHTRPDGRPYPQADCRIFRAYLRGEPTHVEDEVLWRSDGTSFPAEYWSYPIRRGREVVGAVVTFVDISERRRVEEALREYAERSQTLSRRVVEVQEEERRRLARELHDEIGQTLTAIGINLQSIKTRKEINIIPRIDECIAVVDRAIRQVRTLSLDLRPSMLDDLGLVSALRWYLDRQAHLVGYRVRFSTDAEEIHLDPPVATAAFRVAQEALTNVARHARAGRVRLGLRLRDGALHVSVRDDGVGFDPVEAPQRVEGLGLLGMRERAALLGGKVSVRSAPGRGTLVRLTVPLRRGGGGA